MHYAEEIEVAACYADAHHMDEFAYAARYSDKIEFNFQETSLYDENDSVSIEIIDNDIRLKVEDCNFKPLPK